MGLVFLTDLLKHKVRCIATAGLGMDKGTKNDMLSTLVYAALSNTNR